MIAKIARIYGGCGGFYKIGDFCRGFLRIWRQRVPLRLISQILGSGAMAKLSRRLGKQSLIFAAPCPLSAKKPALNGLVARALAGLVVGATSLA